MRFLLLIALALSMSTMARAGRCPDYNPHRTAHFGDLHVHTALSLDAATMGTRNGPRDAYLFARGARVGIQPYDPNDRPMRSLQLKQPLDFTSVTDHAEMLGELEICTDPELEGYTSWVCKIYRSWPRAAFFIMHTNAAYPEEPTRHGFCGDNGEHCLKYASRPWQRIQSAAKKFDDPCSFTTFVGYEITGAPGGKNMHRNVIFRNEQVQKLPVSNFEVRNPEEIWTRIRNECTEAETGCDAVIIPHNSNLSGGLIFKSPATAETAAMRASLEPLVEVMQHKGDSECSPGLGSTDELCGFEKLTATSFMGQFVPFLNQPPSVGSYARSALKTGLKLDAELGINPFEFGMIASTDTHLGTPGYVAETADFPGHGGAGKPARESLPPGFVDRPDYNPGGLAVLWAEQNTRESLFTAMKRREAYGTSGPRILLRFFGGWDYDADLCSSSHLVESGYKQGVPMGGVLPEATSAAPRFVVSAMRDPDGAALDRIQIIKGWTDGDALHEKVYDIAGSGNTSCAFWVDPEFNAAQHAFYYTRVMEIPTKRWSTLYCEDKKIACEEPDDLEEDLDYCCDADVPKLIQERAWSSPIWYRP